MAPTRKQASGSVHLTPEQNLRDRLLTAYLVWLFLGVFGAHRFYLGRTRSGLLMAFVGPLFLAFGLFFHILKGLGISPWMVMSPFIFWWLIDAALIPGWARRATGA